MAKADFLCLCALAVIVFVTPVAPQEITGPVGPLRLGALTIGSNATDQNSTVFRFVERSHLGNRWPLVAGSAYVGCAQSLPRVSVLVVADGVPWAFNAESKAWMMANKAVLDVNGQQVAVNVAGSHEPWLADDAEFPGTQMSAAPLLDIAKRLGCLPKPGSKDAEPR
ncbi:MAG: hypothetical protein ABL901_16680 [Hyphomicrobiaceae bacterium]